MPWLGPGVRVHIGGGHPWAGHAGVIVGEWPPRGGGFDWEVEVDGTYGTRCAADAGDLRAGGEW